MMWRIVGAEKYQLMLDSGFVYIRYIYLIKENTAYSSVI